MSRMILYLPLLLVLLVLISPVGAGLQTPETRTAPLIIGHTEATLVGLSGTAIDQAKQDLHVVYGHTSHGSQVVTGMTGLTSFTHAPYPGSEYAWNDGGSGGALDLHELGNDLGNPDFTTWATMTRSYLDAHPRTNVVIWSWCGELSWATSANVETYLSQMNTLESEYPHVVFVYMTGHLDGTGLSGNLNQRNEQIRQFCREHNKVLYDFADIESYDPDGNEYLSRGATDSCDYDNWQKNWARAWQDSHTRGVDWYSCDAAHTEPLNANLKAYAAWNLWARIAGWQAGQVPTSTTVRPTVIPSLHTIPGTVQAEDYDVGGENVGYYDTTPGNAGGAYRQDDVDIEAAGTGYTLSYIRDGEWTKYSLNVTVSGVYRVNFVVSSPEAGRSIAVEENATERATVVVPDTGSFDTYTSVPVDLLLPSGRQSMTLVFKGNGMNLDSFSFVRLDPIPLQGEGSVPVDLDGNGLCEDLNGNGRLDFADVVLLFNQMDWIDQQGQGGYYDFNGNGRLDFSDIVDLFDRV